VSERSDAGLPRGAIGGAASPRATGGAAASPSPDAAERPLRLFVALDLPDDVRATLAGLGAAADQDVWRPVAAEALHLTLAFLGARPPGDVAAIEPVLAAEAGGPAPRLALAGALLLPPRRPRVLTVGLDDPEGTLAGLQARVSAGLAQAGVYTPETRPFRAHVTVARLRPRARAPGAPETTLEPAAFAAGPLTLYVSRLHPSGARYEPLARAPLATLPDACTSPRPAGPRSQR
jgi:2'-5' RNA ligase